MDDAPGESDDDDPASSDGKKTTPDDDKKQDDKQKGPGEEEPGGKPAGDEEDDEDLKRGKQLLEELQKTSDQQQDSKAGDQQQQDPPKGEEQEKETEPDVVNSKRASIYSKIISPDDFEPRLAVGEDGEEVDIRDYLEANPELPIVMGTYVQRVIENLLGGGVLSDAQSSANEIDTLKKQVNSLRYELRVAAKAQDVYDIVESKEFKDWQKTAPKEALALFRSKNPVDFARGINLYRKTLAKKSSKSSAKAQEADDKARKKMEQKKSLLSHKSGKSAGSGAAGADDFSSAFREASEKEIEIEI
jgi:hypothetical protein